MKTKLIVIASLIFIPFSISFSDIKQPDSIIINNDGSTTTEPMDDGMSPTIRNTRDHIDKTMNDNRERMQQIEQDDIHKMPINKSVQKPVDPNYEDPTTY